MEKYARKGKKEKHRHLKKNAATGEGTSSVRHDDKDDELLGTSAGTLMDQSEIAVEARRQREEALRQR